MAAKEKMLEIHENGAEIASSRLDCIISRWNVDYYIFSALNAFRDGRYTDFCQFRDILQCLVARPLEHSENLVKKMRVMQFLSRINDGDKLDYTFDSQDALTPLESAMLVLDSISQEQEVLQQDLERVHKSVSEMLVILCIKNGEFAKAKEVLTNHFPNVSVGKEAILMGLVQQKSTSHPALEQVTYEQFKAEMLQFSESLFTNSEPFLYKTARKLVALRPQMEDGRPSDHQPTPQDSSLVHAPPTEPSESAATPGPSETAGGVQVKLSLLRACFAALAKEHSVDIPFAQLEEEVEREVREENADMDRVPSPCQGSHAPLGSNKPEETAWAERARQHTVARLVVEEDSLESELESVASQESTNMKKKLLVSLERSVSKRQQPSSSKEPPTASRETPTSNVAPPTASRETPSSRKEPPTASRETLTSNGVPPTATRETSSSRKEPPTTRKELPSSSREPPMSPPSSPTVPYRKARKRPVSVAQVRQVGFACTGK
ncbi:telomeric repeat binding factor a isoform X2 [Megalops cyprinoides]|uniref:telomeric repeat binding factor a isoform X2 n=1 Tax=Megalops cyprinoides TaxID=118141 RepID=UPI001864BEEF|nr:telomeric repeat binding factor a isoform X2 [Megalops cyprinoides]